MNNRTFTQDLLGVQNDLLRFAYKLTSDREEANDLLQETSLKALDNEEKYTPDTNFKGWIYTIMRNIFINNYRKVVRDQTFVDTTDNLYHLNTPHDLTLDSTEGAYDLKEMHRIVNALPREYKIPFSMHVSGFKYREIAEKLNLPLGTITINVAACLIVLLGSLLGTESPLTITQMLWVNLIMDTFAAGALASLPPNERVMKDKPRRSGKDGDFIITRPMAYNIFGVGLAFVIVLMGLLLHFHAQDGLTPHDLSWFFSFFVMLQFWNMFNAKAFMEDRSAFANLKESKSFLMVALLIIAGQYLIVTFGGEMFSVVPLSWKDWGTIIGSTSLVLWIGEIGRLIERWRK